MYTPPSAPWALSKKRGPPHVAKVASHPAFHLHLPALPHLSHELSDPRATLPRQVPHMCKPRHTDTHTGKEAIILHELALLESTVSLS